MAYIKANKPENALEYVTALRAMREETKATHLENLFRASQKSKTIPEPDAKYLQPEVPKPPLPPQDTSQSKGQGRMSITGNAQINLKGGSAPKSASKGAKTSYALQSN